MLAESGLPAMSALDLDDWRECCQSLYLPRLRTASFRSLPTARQSEAIPSRGAVSRGSPPVRNRLAALSPVSNPDVNDLRFRESRSPSPSDLLADAVSADLGLAGICKWPNPFNSWSYRIAGQTNTPQGTAGAG